MTPEEANKALVLRMEDEIFNHRNLAAIDEFVAPAYVLRTAPAGTPADREAVRASMSMYLAGFPDLHVTVDELIAVEDKVVARLTYSGTHDGDLFGIPPTNKRISVGQIAIYRIEAAQVVEEWEVSDQLGLLQQIGAMSQQ